LFGRGLFSFYTMTKKRRIGTGEIKALETAYSGCLFRNRLEARWAVFFDALGVSWEYEKQGYALASGCYLPDFYLPDLECWVEIKPDTPSDLEKSLSEELADFTDRPALFGIGLPGAERLWVYCQDANDNGGGLYWWDDAEIGECSVGRIHWAFDMHGYPCLCSSNSSTTRRFYTPTEGDRWSAMQQIQKCEHRSYWTQRMSRCYRAASSSRFENGEAPRFSH
jgi:hypothetical protein